MRYAPGHKGPTLPGPTREMSDSMRSPKPQRPSLKPRPSDARPNIPVFSDTKPPRPAPTGPMVPVRGGGMAPQSLAYIMKKAPMMKKGGSVSSASSRADGCATKGKTKGKII